VSVSDMGKRTSLRRQRTRRAKEPGADGDAAGIMDEGTGQSPGAATYEQYADQKKEPQSASQENAQRVVLSVESAIGRLTHQSL